MEDAAAAAAAATSASVVIYPYKNVSPKLDLQEGIVKLAIKTALQCQPSGAALDDFNFLFMSSTHVDTEYNSLSLIIEQFDRGLNNNNYLLPTTQLPDAVYIPSRFVYKPNLDDKTDDDSVNYYFNAVKLLANYFLKFCAQIDSISKILSMSSTIYYTNVIPNSNANSNNILLNSTFDLITMANRFDAQRIQPIPIIDTSLLKTLQTTSSFYLKPKTGYCALYKNENVLLIMDTEPKANKLALMGIWVSGTSSVNHPLTWAACIRYAFSSLITNKSSDFVNSFLIVFFPSTTKRAEFYMCKPTNSRLEFTLFNGSNKILVNKSTNENRCISIDFNEIKDGYNYKLFANSVNQVFVQQDLYIQNQLLHQKQITYQQQQQQMNTSANNSNNISKDSGVDNNNSFLSLSLSSTSSSSSTSSFSNRKNNDLSNELQPRSLSAAILNSKPIQTPYTKKNDSSANNLIVGSYHSVSDISVLSDNDTDTEQSYFNKAKNNNNNYYSTDRLDTKYLSNSDDFEFVKPRDPPIQSSVSTTRLDNANYIHNNNNININNNKSSSSSLSNSTTNSKSMLFGIPRDSPKPTVPCGMNLDGSFNDVTLNNCQELSLYDAQQVEQTPKPILKNKVSNFTPILNSTNKNLEVSMPLTKQVFMTAPSMVSPIPQPQQHPPPQPTPMDHSIITNDNLFSNKMHTIQQQKAIMHHNQQQHQFQNQYEFEHGIRQPVANELSKKQQFPASFLNSSLSSSYSSSGSCSSAGSSIVSSTHNSHDDQSNYLYKMRQAPVVENFCPTVLNNSDMPLIMNKSGDFSYDKNTQFIPQLMSQHQPQLIQQNSQPQYTSQYPSHHPLTLQAQQIMSQFQQAHVPQNQLVVSQTHGPLIQQSAHLQLQIQEHMQLIQSQTPHQSQHNSLISNHYINEQPKNLESNDRQHAITYPNDSTKKNMFEQESRNHIQTREEEEEEEVEEDDDDSNQYENVFGAALKELKEHKNSWGGFDGSSQQSMILNNNNISTYSAINSTNSSIILPKFQYVSLLLDDYDKNTSLNTEELAMKYLKHIPTNTYLQAPQTHQQQQQQPRQYNKFNYEDSTNNKNSYNDPSVSTLANSLMTSCYLSGDNSEISKNQLFQYYTAQNTIMLENSCSDSNDNYFLKSNQTSSQQVPTPALIKNSSDSESDYGDDNDDNDEEEDENETDSDDQPKEDDEGNVWLFSKPPSSNNSNSNNTSRNNPKKRLRRKNRSGGYSLASSAGHTLNKDFSDQDEDPDRDVTNVLNIDKIKQMPKLL